MQCGGLTNHCCEETNAEESQVQESRPRCSCFVVRFFVVHPIVSPDQPLGSKRQRHRKLQQRVGWPGCHADANAIRWIPCQLPLLLWIKKRGGSELRIHQK